MNKKVMIGLSTLALILVLSTLVIANPNAINIQGKLTSSSGTLQTGTFNFSFKIYDSFTGGSILYQTTINATTDARGIYDVVLQDINLPFDRQYFLGVTVGTDAEMTPRVNLTSVPYSLSANRSSGLNTSEGITVGGGFANGGVTIESDGDILTNGDIIFSGNITVVNITKLSINGSLSPSIDATFDVGNNTNRWRNANFSGFLQAATIIADTIISPGLSTIWNKTGTNVYLANGGDNVGIGTTTPGTSLEISDSEDTEFIRLSDTTNGDSVGIFSGSGSPEGIVTAQQGSLYLDHATGSLFRKDSDIGNANWVEVGSENTTTLLGNDTVRRGKATRETNQTIPTATATVLELNTTQFANGVVVDSNATHSLNITKEGTYLVSGSWAAQTTLDDQEYVAVAIYKNNAPWKWSYNYISTASSNVDQFVEIQDVMQLSIGDYIQLIALHTDGTDLNTSTELEYKPRISAVQLDPSLTAAGGWVDGNGSVFLDDSSQNVSAGAFFVDNTNNRLGINTVFPNHGLDVVGSINATNLNLTGNLRAGDLTSCTALETDSEGNFICGGDMLNSSLWNRSGTSVFLNDDTNSVGIGTSSPAQLLDVDGTAQVATLRFNDSGGNSVFWELFENTSNSLAFTYGNELFTIDSSGSIGINTSTPSANLEITAAEDNEFIRLSDGTNSDSISIYTGSGSPEGVVSAQRGSLYMDHASSTFYKKTVDGGSSSWVEIASASVDGENSSSWNDTGTRVILSESTDAVGIGTNNPTEKLVVVGSANVTNNLTVGSVNSSGVITAAAFRGDGENITGLNFFNRENITEYLGGTEINSTIIKVANVSGFLQSVDAVYNNNNLTEFIGENASIIRTDNTTNFPLGWVNLTNYPSACTTGEFVTAVGDTLTCGSIGVAASTAGGWSNNSDDAFTNRNVLVDTNLFYANTSTDRVGIGTDRPVYKFQVANIAGANVNLSDTLYIQGTNIGIGTSAPSEKLVVIGSVNISDSVNVSGTVQATSFIGDGSLITGLNVFNRENVTEYLGGSDINGTIIKVANVSGFLQSVDAVFNTGNLTEFIGSNASIVRANNITGFQLEAPAFKNENLTSLLGTNESNSYWNQSGSDIFMRDQNQNLGVGTDTPSEKLTIMGNMTINATGGEAGGSILFNGSHICIGSC